MISPTKIEIGGIGGQPPSRAALSLELTETLGYNGLSAIDKVNKEGRPNKFSREYVAPILYRRGKKHNSSNAPDSDFVSPTTRSALGLDTYTKNINGVTTSFTIDSR